MKKLIIIGGGFAGAKIAKSLENYLETTLIDSKDYFEFTPGVLRTIINPNHLKKIQVLHSHYLKKTKIVKSCVKKISHKEVILQNNQKIPFDYLVIASGSRYNLPFKEKDIVIATRGSHIKNYHNVLEKTNNVTIIGGGLVGTELAGEISWKYPDKKITIIHSHNKIILRNNHKSSKYAQKYLEKKGVKIITKEKASTKEKDILTTNEGTKISSDIVFLCTGITPNSDFINKKADIINEKKQIKVNEFLQLEDYKNIFAAGDVTNINEEKTAQNAEKQAGIVIKNIIRLESNKQLVKYNAKPRIMVISLGKYNGILEYKNFVLTGIIPAFLKWFVEWKTMIRYKSRLHKYL